MKGGKLPSTLQDAMRYFSDEQVCFEFVRDLRFPDGVIPCPTCQATEHYFISTRRLWKCKTCKRQFSVKVGTIFEDSAIKLDKWLAAMWLIANCKNGVSSYEIHRAVGVTQKTAWFMLHRIRLAMQAGTFTELAGRVEADETYLGGKNENRHKDKRTKSRGVVGKTAVFGMVERGGVAFAKVVPNSDKRTLANVIVPNIHGYAKLYTDGHSGYDGIGFYVEHQRVNHQIEYVRGHVHTNSIENFWSLFKRTVKGTYIHLDPRHVQAYADEQVFRFNTRKSNDLGRFLWATSGVSGRRLTYKRLTSKSS